MGDWGSLWRDVGCLPVRPNADSATVLGHLDFDGRGELSIRRGVDTVVFSIALDLGRASQTDLSRLDVASILVHDGEAWVRARVVFVSGGD